MKNMKSAIALTLLLLNLEISAQNEPEKPSF